MSKDNRLIATPGPFASAMMMVEALRKDVDDDELAALINLALLQAALKNQYSKQDIQTVVSDLALESSARGIAKAAARIFEYLLLEERAAA